MNIPLPDNSPSRKISIRTTRNNFAELPLKNNRRRKSSISLQLRNLINNNNQNKKLPELSIKNNYKEPSSSKKNIKEIVNGSIPEESETSSNNNKEDKIKKKKKLKKKGKVNENNNYYIHYIKNVYENESHLNKENLIKSANKNISHSFLKFIESNNNLRNSSKRRNSALNKNLFKSKFHNINLYLDKEQINQNIPASIIDKKKISELESLLHKKKLDDKQKEIVKIYLNKSKHKNNKHKEEENCITIADKNINNEKNNINNNDDMNIKKNVKEKDILENEKKADTENNTESTKSKKRSKIKKFLCCIINSNCDSSVDNN